MLSNFNLCRYTTGPMLMTALKPMGSSVAKLPTNERIVAWGRQKLGMKWTL